MSERPASFTGDVLKVQGGGVTIIVLHKSNRVIFERRNNFWNIYPADGIIYFDMVMSNVYHWIFPINFYHETSNNIWKDIVEHVKLFLRYFAVLFVILEAQKTFF